MRLLFTTFLALVSLALFSQSPEKINYQSIVRDLAGNVIQNQPISLRMSILSDSINGTIVYQETFQPTTNNFGLVNIKIGEGTPVIATMSSVDWSNGPFFLESAVDVTAGTNYVVVSTSQFMSVPYALYASESPLDTTQVQNIVNQQTNNFLDSTSIQNMIDSSVLNIDSTLIASWGYIDSNSIMILINNNSLDSNTIQNMIDNSIVNIDSSTVASWGYLDSSTIQILINNSTIDSSSVSNWGYLDSTTIQNIITQQTNNYLDSTSVQNMIDNSVTNIDSSTVASWGYVDSSSVIILINNNSLDSAAIQNMINSSITNVDSSTVASWGYLDSSSIIALISNSNIDSSSVASWGYLDSVSIQNMINNSSNNVDSAMIANFGFVAGPHTIDTDTQIDSTGIANYGFVTSSQVLDSSSVQNMINNSSSNVDSSTVANWGFVDSSTVINLINESGYLDSLTIQSMIDLVTNSNGNFSSGEYSVFNPSFTSTGSIGQYISAEHHFEDLSFIFLNLTNNTNSSIDVLVYFSDSSNVNINLPADLEFNYGKGGQYGSSDYVSVIPIPRKKFFKIRLNNSGSIHTSYKFTFNSDSTNTNQNNSTIDSTTVANWGFSTDTDTQIDSAGIANLGFVAGPHTIDTDTQIDSAGIANLGYVAGPHTIDTDTQIDSAGIAGHGFLDSVRIMELINQNGTKSTKTFGWPQGYGGDLVSFNFNQSDTTFIVPPDKNYYITSVYNAQQVQFSAPDVRINGLSYWGPFNLGYDNLTMPLILHPNDSIYVKDYQSMSFLALAFDTSSAVKMITHNFNISPTFTVPNGKLFVYQKNTPVNINNIPINQNTPSISKGGDVITPTNTPSGNWYWISGYLVDEDYFKTNSGTSSGSGSGSSSGSGSNGNTLIYTTSGF